MRSKPYTSRVPKYTFHFTSTLILSQYHAAGTVAYNQFKRKIFRCMQSIWEITKERVYSRKDKNACISGEVKAIVHSCVYFHEYLTFLID